MKCFYRHDLLFCDIEDPSIASKTQLVGQMALKDDSNGFQEGWDELVKDPDVELVSSVLDMQGNDNNDVIIPQLN